ncbi:MAG: DUF4054 domain-containing protein [Sutterella sp.]|nr:DUF4054 domain-containing protein [Sutterella sp.]
MNTPFSFDIAEFRERYPGLTEAKISDGALNGCWDDVKALLADEEGNFPYPPSKIKPILFAALCHMATLATNDRDQPGRITSATEGSVSVSFEALQIKSETGQWWQQTKCGALFWALTLPYRSGLRFYPGRKIVGIY